MFSVRTTQTAAACAATRLRRTGCARRSTSVASIQASLRTSCDSRSGAVLLSGRMHTAGAVASRLSKGSKSFSTRASAKAISVPRPDDRVRDCGGVGRAGRDGRRDFRGPSLQFELLAAEGFRLVPLRAPNGSRTTSARAASPMIAMTSSAMPSAGSPHPVKKNRDSASTSAATTISHRRKVMPLI